MTKAGLAAALDMPGPGDVHIWCCYDAAITDSALLERYWHELDSGEKARHARFRFDKHRHQFLVTRALVRNVLSLYAPEVAAAAWRFGANAYGKPCIVTPLEYPLQFNLSHADGIITLALGTHELGIDVEAVSRMASYVDGAASYLSSNEFALLGATPRALQGELFCTLWTLKEAYLKARGTGLTTQLDQFSFSLPGLDGIAAVFSPQLGDDPADWMFWTMRANPDHLVALAQRSVGPVPQISVREVIPGRTFHAVQWDGLRECVLQR